MATPASPEDSEVSFRENPRSPEEGQGDISFPVEDEVLGSASDDEQGVHRIADDRRSRERIEPTARRRRTVVSRPTITIKPESYDGNSDWDEYFSHFSNCAELGNWPQQERLLVLSASLKGTARTFYMGLTVYERHVYQILIERLDHRFGSNRQKDKWLSRLDTRQRQPGESIAVLADDLRHMTQRAYKDLDCRAQEVIALTQLYKMLRPELKYQCIDKSCCTVYDAVEIIERYEALFGDSTDRKRTAVRFANSSPSCLDVDSDPNGKILNQILNRLDGLEKKLPRSDANQRRSPATGARRHGPSTRSDNRTCYHCDSPDHFIKDCPHRQQPSRRSGNDRLLTQ